MTLKFWDMKNFENFKFELFSQGTYDSQNLRYETQVIADYEYVKISRIAVMDIKLWMKKDLDLHTDQPWCSFSNSLTKSARIMQNISWF